MDALKALKVGGAVFTLAAAVFGATLYWLMAQANANLVYLALYHDDLAAAAWDTGHDEMALAFSGTAWRFCELYGIEQRTMSSEYAELCSVIQRRSDLISACYDDPAGAYCTDDMIENFTRSLGAVEPVAERLEENPPYAGFVFSDEYTGVECYMGGEKVPCPEVGDHADKRH